MSNPLPSPGNRPLDQLKVAELRDELRKRGLSLKGVKKDLLERLDEAIQKEQAGIVGDKEEQCSHASVLPIDQDSTEPSHDDDGTSYLNDVDTTQDTSLIVNNASPYVGGPDITPVFMEPHEDVDREPSVKEGTEDSSKDEGASVAEVLESDKSIVDPDNIVFTEKNFVEPVVISENQALDNMTELGNQGGGTEIVADVANNENPDPNTILPEISGQDTVSPSSTGEFGASDVGIGARSIDESLVLELADDTFSAPAQDVAVAGVIGALEQEISIPEVTSASDLVIPPEGDKDIPSASVSDDILNTAGASVVLAVETVVNTNDCPMQDIEVFETTVLTSVSVVTCVQESGKELDDGALNIGMSENAKEELMEEDRQNSIFQDGSEAMEALGDAPEMPILEREAMEALGDAPEMPILEREAMEALGEAPETLILEAAQELQLPEPEGTDGNAAHLDLVAQEELGDTVMSETHEDAPVKPADLEVELPAAASEAPSVPIKTESENIDGFGVDDAGTFKENARVKIIEDLSLDVKPEPREAESRVSRRAAVEIVKMEQQDIKEESLQKGRNSERSRPRDYETDRLRDHEYDRARDHESDRFRHSSVRVFDERGRVENRSGRQFKEDVRKHVDETVYKFEDGVDGRAGQKRKDDDRDAKQQEPAKRMRRWNSGNPPALEVAKPLTSGVVNEIVSPDVKREEYAVAPPKLSAKLPGPPKPAPPAAKSGFEANGEKRIVPPSTRPPSASLKIEKFVRPFTLKAVKDLLAEFGECVDFWMDQIKTHCFVTFSKVEEAVAARNGLYDRQWPPSFGNLLIASFVDASEVKLRSDGTFEKTNTPALSTPRGIPNHPPLLTAQHNNANTLASAPPLRERQLMQPPIKDPEPPVPTLDDLFRKTKAKPHIYYLPLTDEQVAEKLAVLKNEKLVAVRNNTQQPARGRPVGRV